jgi:flagellar motor switch protein FliN/FliY
MLAELEARSSLGAAEPGTAQVKVFPEPTPGDGALPAARLERVLDIPLELRVELGRARMPMRDLLRVTPGAVVELDRLAGEPLDLLINGCLVARGEVVVADDRFGIRLTDVLSLDERLQRVSR